MNQPYLPSEWRLFIDGSIDSLKAVLIHNGNSKPSIPLAYGFKMKETYDTMSKILSLIKYHKYKWKICADLKVIAILTGLQGGYTKHCCFLCLWESRNRKEHYIKKDWPKRNTKVPGRLNVKYPPLVADSDVLLPPLHIKLGLMRQFVKALNEKSTAFEYLKSKFPLLSHAKIKEGIFVGPQIRKLFDDKEFEKHLNIKEKSAWQCFKNVVDGFLGNNRDPNYATLVKQLLLKYKAIKANMSLKVHFLHSHLDFFPRNLGAMSDEQGERFHQDIKVLESRFNRKCTKHMMAEYTWFLTLSDQDQEHNRKSRTKRFF